MVRALNVLSVRAGTAEERQHKIALNWAMIKIAPEQGRAETGKPATANINLALAILAINTPAQAPATPVAPARLAVANIPNVLVNHPILGHQVLVNAHQLINTLAPAPAMQAALAPPVAVSIPNAIVQVIIVGMVAVVLFLVHQVINIHAPVRATPVVWAPPAAENIPLANAPTVMNGKMVVAKNKHRMEQLASCIIAMAKLLVYVLQVWASMLR